MQQAWSMRIHSLKIVESRAKAMAHPSVAYTNVKNHEKCAWSVHRNSGLKWFLNYSENIFEWPQFSILQCARRKCVIRPGDHKWTCKFYPNYSKTRGTAIVKTSVTQTRNHKTLAHVTATTQEKKIHVKGCVFWSFIVTFTCAGIFPFTMNVCQIAPYSVLWHVRNYPD